MRLEIFGTLKIENMSSELVTLPDLGPIVLLASRCRGSYSTGTFGLIFQKTTNPTINPTKAAENSTVTSHNLALF